MMQIWVLLTAKLGAGSHRLASENLPAHPWGQMSLRTVTETTVLGYKPSTVPGESRKCLSMGEMTQSF